MNFTAIAIWELILIGVSLGLSLIGFLFWRKTSRRKYLVFWSLCWVVTYLLTARWWLWLSGGTDTNQVGNYPWTNPWTDDLVPWPHFLIWLSGLAALVLALIGGRNKFDAREQDALVWANRAERDKLRSQRNKDIREAGKANDRAEVRRLKEEPINAPPVHKDKRRVFRSVSAIISLVLAVLAAIGIDYTDPGANFHRTWNEHVTTEQNRIDCNNDVAKVGPAVEKVQKANAKVEATPPGSPVYTDLVTARDTAASELVSLQNRIKAIPNCLGDRRPTGQFNVTLPADVDCGLKATLDARGVSDSFGYTYGLVVTWQTLDTNGNAAVIELSVDPATGAVATNHTFDGVGQRALPVKVTDGYGREFPDQSVTPDLQPCEE